MIKTKNILAIAAVVLCATACTNDDLPLTHADGYGEVAFSVGNATRADITYIPYDYARDPHTMGTFGWHDLSSSTIDNAANKMFDNTEVTATMDENIVTWSYENKKYWFDYADYTSFDFFGYMPYNESTTLTSPEDNVYTLTMPVEFSDDYDVFSPEETALVCAEPQHKVLGDGTIPFRMDQTLTAYTLKFQLGEAMDNVRDFIVKDVKIYGESLAHSGTVTRSYTWDSSEKAWVSGNITWVSESITRMDVTRDNACSIPYRNNAGEDETLAQYYDDENSQLRVTNTAVQWGTPIYMIPADVVNPIFEVVYDAVVTDENGNDIVTRKDIHSTIQLNSEIFGTLTLGTMGKYQPITVKIVPDHLYVLADADQTFGWVVME